MFYSHIVFVVSDVCLYLYVYYIYIYIVMYISVYVKYHIYIYIHISIQYIYMVLHSPQASSISSTFWDAFRCRKPAVA